MRGLHYEHYRLLLDGAGFADSCGLAALWVPERHFHSFGGFSPNPAVLASALTQRTHRVGLRAGSIAAPLHHPARIAEEWAIVDRMSGGRAGVAFASGWHDRDFVLAPGSYAERRDITLRRIDEVRRLWRGEALEFPCGNGMVTVNTSPRPIQPELPVWLTTQGSDASFVAAGQAGAGVLTNLLNQDVEHLERRISRYRQAWREAGHDDRSGHVTVLLHTLLGDDPERIRSAAAQPLRSYLRSAIDLTGRMSPGERRIDADRLAAADRDYLVRSAGDRLLHHRSLIGSVQTSLALVSRLRDAGVDEIACFVDFGAPPDLVRAGFAGLEDLRGAMAAQAAPPAPLPQRPAARLRSVPRASTDDSDTLLPTTPNQRLVWAAAQLSAEASTAYNLRRVLRLTGELDAEALRAAFRDLVDRHEALRVGFGEDGTSQRVASHRTIDLETVDVPEENDDPETVDLPASAGAALSPAVTRWLAREIRQPFDLSNGPLIRGYLIKIAESVHLLCLTVHHVAVDGTAENVLLEELGQLYERHRDGGPPLPEPPRLTEHIHRLASEPARPADLEFWRQQFDPPPDPLLLGEAVRARPIIGHAGARLHRAVDPELLHGIQHYGAAHNASPFMVVLAAYTLVLHELAGQTDVVVGIPVSRRSTDGPEARLVAYCANLLPIRSRRVAGDDFAGHVGAVRRTMLDALAHQACSLADIIEALPRGSRWGRPSVLSTVFTWDRVGVPELRGVQVRHVETGTSTARFDLGLNISHYPDGHRLAWEYNTGLFREADVRRLHERFEELVRSAIGLDRDVESSEPSEPSGPVLSLVERWAADHPGHVAIRQGGVALPAGMVVERARALAARLVAQGVGPGDRVGLAVEPGPGRLVGLLGTLWSGAICVPLDEAGDVRVPATVVADRMPPPTQGRMTVVPLDSWQPGPRPALPTIAADSSALALPTGQTVTHRQLSAAIHPGVADPTGQTPVALPTTMNELATWTALLGAAAGGASVSWDVSADRVTSGHEETVLVDGGGDGDRGEDQPPPVDDSAVRDESEERMARIWSEVLHRTDIDADSDFFELGGDSLRGIQILVKVRKAFGRELPLGTFFEASTVRELTRQVLSAGMRTPHTGVQARRPTSRSDTRS